jgi:hypothetical protein
VAAYGRALTLTRANHRVLMELAALRGLGKAYAATGRRADGIDCLEAAVRLCRQKELPEAAKVAAELATIRAD